MKLLTRKKIIILGVLVISLCGLGTAYTAKFHTESKQVKKARSTLETQFKKTIKAIYLDDTQEMVKTDVSPEILKKAEELVKKAKTEPVTKKLVSSLKTGLLMEFIQRQLDSFFDEEGVANYYSSNEEEISTVEVELDKVESKKEFTTIQLEKIKVFRASYKEAEDATNAVVTLFEGDSVNEGITRERYKQVKEQVEALKQIDLKKQLTEQLMQVDTKMAEKEAIQLADVNEEQEV